METLYLDISCEKDFNGSIFTDPTSVAVIFVLRYLESKDVRVVFIRSQTPRTVHVLDTSYTPYDIIEEDKIPETVSRCQRPALISERDCIVRCGLGTVVRHLVQRAHESHPEKKFMELLVNRF